MTQPVDLDALEQLADKATSGPWELHYHGHIESGCRCMSCYACTGWTLRHMRSCDDVAALWDEAERGQSEPGVSCDSDVFIYDDARFIAAAREAIPALITELRDLRAALVELAPARAAIPGPDSERIREVIRRVLMKTRFRDPENMADPIVAALRTDGLLPGPDTITVNREDLRNAVEQIEDSALVIPNYFAGTYERLRAALSEPPAPKEQQP
jgi:hypothetical protein